jgi:hypothetical protein
MNILLYIDFQCFTFFCNPSEYYICSMRGVKISYYSKPDKESSILKRRQYSVHLGRDRGIKYFTNEKEVKKYLVEISKVLTFRLNEAIQIHLSLQKLYWTNWSLFDLSRNGGAAKLRAARNIEENFNLISDNFYRIWLESNYDSGFSYVMQRFDLLNRHFTDNCELIKSNLPVNYTTTKIELDILRGHIENWFCSVESFENKIHDNSQLSERVLKVV